MKLNIRRTVFNLLFCSSFLLLLTSSWCFLDRSTSGGSGPTAAPTTPRIEAPFGAEGYENSWSARAFPGYACPGDNITYEWNVGDPICAAGTGPSCQTLTVMDNLLVLAPFTSRNLFGSQSYGSVSSIDSWSGANPQFTFSVTHDDPGDRGWNNITSEVEIIQPPPADPIEVNFKAEAYCDPTRRRWSLFDFRLNMSSDSFKNSTGGLGSCVRITSICYRPSSETGSTRYNPVTISEFGGDSMASATLIPDGPCLEGINLMPDLHYQIFPDPTPPASGFGEPCNPDGLGTPGNTGPFINLLFTLSCDSNLPECGN